MDLGYLEGHADARLEALGGDGDGGDVHVRVQETLGLLVQTEGMALQAAGAAGAARAARAAQAPPDSPYLHHPQAAVWVTHRVPLEQSPASSSVIAAVAPAPVGPAHSARLEPAFGCLEVSPQVHVPTLLLPRPAFPAQLGLHSIGPT